MPGSGGLQLRSRALANVTRGLGGSLPLALLVSVLARHLTDDDFAVWVLVVQIASYVGYLEFGVQTAVSRTVAYRVGAGRPSDASGPIGAGVRLLAKMGAVGLVVVAGFAALLPFVVSVPDGHEATARAALVVLGAAAAIGLPGSAIHGALVGAGHHWWSAVTVAGTRSVSVAVTMFGAWQGWSVPALAVCVAGGTLVNGLGVFAVARHAGLPPIGKPSAADRGEVRAVTTTVATWTVATLIISGLDVLVVGVVDFENVSAYGLAAGLIVIGSSGYGILASVLIPAFADQAARDDDAGARLLLTRTTVASCGALLSALVAGLTLRSWLMDGWAGKFADDAEQIFVVLLITAVVRLSLSPIGSYLMGFGDHRSARVPAIAEAALNLTFSIVLGAMYGAIGVAVGSLLASGAALGLYVFKVGPRTVGVDSFRSAFQLRYAISACAAAPFAALVLIEDRTAPRLVIGAVGIIVQIAIMSNSLSRLPTNGAATRRRDLRAALRRKPD